MNVVLTDVGEEIDDEVMFHLATKTSEDDTWFFICVPGASSTDPNDAQEEVTRRLVRFKTLFPFLESVPNETHFRWTSPLRSTFYVGPPEMLSQTTGLKIDNLIRIAPLWHIEPSYFAQLIGSVKNYIVMGDTIHPDQSINLTKAMPVGNVVLRSQYDEQEAVINALTERVLSIPTRLARNVALPFALVNTLPECLREPLLETAFDQFVGRVPPHLCYANNISVVNHKTIMNYLGAESIENVPDAVLSAIKCQVEEFLQQASETDQNDSGYRTRLEEIAAAIYVLTGGVPYRDGSRFHKDNLLDPEQAKLCWMEHIHANGCNLTPCYDLLALVVKEKGHVPDESECQALVQEFASL